jgi:predicted nuclease of predicted toxin-antitoxin system
MLLFLSDEDFNRRIVRGLRRRLPHLDIARVQDVGLIARPDTEVLERAANENRVVLTHDVSTMSKHAFDRVNQKLTMPGVIEISQDVSIGEAIEELVLIAECSLENEWQNQVIYLPLKS